MLLFLATVGIVVVSAWAVRRLLGIRRGRWPATALAVFLGQVAALGVLQAVTGDFLHLGWHWYPVGLALAVTLSLVVHVVLEMFRRPGTRARAVRVPHPVRAVRRQVGRGHRYLQVSSIAVRSGLLRSSGGVEEAGGSRLGRSLAVTLERSGGLFVKLGQAMAAQPRLVTPAVAAELARLQEQAAPADPAAAMQVVRDEIGDPQEAFASFAPEPVASASIGQTYFATLRDGREVVVKVQRPGIAESVERDLDILTRLADRLEDRTLWARAIGLRELAGGFVDSTRAELDYRLEAANCVAAVASLRPSDPIAVPGIVGEFTTRRVMVQERVRGRSVGSPGAFDGVDRAAREALADGFLTVVVRQMVAGEPYHADLHPGNVFLDDEGRLAMIDFGSVGRLDRYERAALVDIFRGLQREDPTLLRQAALRIGTPSARVDVDALDRELARLLGRSLVRGQNLDPGLFADVVFVFRDFGIALPRSSTTLFRALATALSTLEIICPSYDIVDAVGRLEGEISATTAGPRTVKEFVERDVLSAAPVLARLPRDVDDVARALLRGELRTRVSLFSEPEDVAVVRGLLNTFLTGLIGTALVLASAVLVTVDPGPGEMQGLVRTVGGIGLAFAVALLLRVVAKIFREEA